MTCISKTTATILVVYILKRIHCSLEPLPDELSSRLSLAKCVAEVSDQFFKEGEIVLVSLPIQEVSTLQASATLLNNLLFYELFHRSQHSIIIKKTTTFKRHEVYQKSIDNYVIQVRNLSELKQNLRVLQGYFTWNPHARFVVVSVADYGNNKDAAANIIQQLWEHKVASGIVLLPNPQNRSSYETFSWFPFAGSHCGDGFEEVKIIDKCYFGKFDNGTDWFPDKIPHDLNGCPVRVVTVVWPPYVLAPEKKISGTKNEYDFRDGLEIRLMNTMAKAANFSVVYITSEVGQDWGFVDINGRATGAFQYLKNEEADAAISSFAVSVESHFYFDSIVYDIPEALIWCVPHATHVPKWKNLLDIIPVDTCMILIAIYTVVCFCMWRLSVYEHSESNLYKKLINCLQNVLAVILNIAVKVQPKSLTVRCFFMIWVFFTLHINVEYQTSLISAFSHPRYEKQIKTVTDIFENNLKLWLLSTAKPFFMNNDDWVSVKIVQNWNDCANISICLSRTAYNRDSGTCTPRLYKEFINNLYVNQKKEPLLYCFKESIVTFPLQMLLRKGYPLKEYFLTLYRRISAAGLTAHWERQILENQLKTSSDSSETTDDNTEFKITIEHLYLLFVYLVLGYISGFVTLLAEIHVSKRFGSAFKK